MLTLPKQFYGIQLRIHHLTNPDFQLELKMSSKPYSHNRTIISTLNITVRCKYQFEKNPREVICGENEKQRIQNGHLE